jgi:hypothetical protein
MAVSTRRQHDNLLAILLTTEESPLTSGEIPQGFG